MVLPSNVASITKRSGTSFARGTTIDEYLSTEDCQALYDKWQPTWPEPFNFRGGIRAITCEMVLEVEAKDFIKVLGKKRAEKILEVSRVNAGR